MFQQHQKNPYSRKEDQPRHQAQVDVPVTKWVRMFCSLQAEHLQLFPKDGPHMPKYVDWVIQMVNTGSNWQYFDKTYCQKRAKKATKTKSKGQIMGKE